MSGKSIPSFASERRARLRPARLFASLFCALLALSTQALGVEPTRAQTAGTEQSSFHLEETVQRPVTIPEDVLRGLGQDEKVLQCLKETDKAAVEIPASWFVAGAVNLNADKLPDLVVKGQNSCLWGANIGPFWVFRNTGRGYALVLRTDALSLSIQPERTRGFRNIHTRSASARQVFTRLFRFNGQNYQVRGR